MSIHDFALMGAHSGHDHFPSAFLQGYHPSFEHAALHTDTHPRAAYVPRHSSASYPPSFEYTHSALTHAPILPRSAPALAPLHSVGLRAVSSFDPRPPHAGWTPKEEVDDEETRRLLAGGGSIGSRGVDADARIALLPSSTEPPRDDSDSPPATTSKTYSFVSLPGNSVRKRPRRRYDEIERLYACAWPDCTKAYGTLNHLNAHVSMQRHGPKRSPVEFKELRKQWRQQKKRASPRITWPDGVSHQTRRASIDYHDGASAHPVSPTSTSVHTHPSPITVSHRLSLTALDVRYAPSRSVSDDDHDTIPIGPSPTSSASDSAYWQDSPVETAGETGHLVHQQHTQTQYAMQDPSPPLSPNHLGSELSPPLVGMGRLPPDSTLLTPLPGYRPPSPAGLSPLPHVHGGMSPVGLAMTPRPGSVDGGGYQELHQSLHQHEHHHHRHHHHHHQRHQQHQHQHQRSPGQSRGYDEYHDRRSA